MPDTLITIFPKAEDLLALEPEELGGVLLEIIPTVLQNDLFQIGDLLHAPFTLHGPRYENQHHRPVKLAVAEALSWLQSQGLIMSDPGQNPRIFVLTRRAKALRNRADVEAYRKGRILPVDLLQPGLLEKVWPLFLRGDHDVAVFQAFKEVEVAVRQAANVKGAGYGDDVVGVTLMRRAFHPENGPLHDPTLVPAEREAETSLFAGSIGHAKNPAGHRDVVVTPEEAARLIVFASHLLAIVAERAGA